MEKTERERGKKNKEMRRECGVSQGEEKVGLQDFGFAFAFL